MREAGFTDEEIRRWEKSATHPSRTLLGGRGDDDRDGDLSGVKWKKRGEEREWDVGMDVLPPGSDGASAEANDKNGGKETKEREKRKPQQKGRWQAKRRRDEERR